MTKRYEKFNVKVGDCCGMRRTWRFHTHGCWTSWDEAEREKQGQTTVKKINKCMQRKHCSLHFNEKGFSKWRARSKSDLLWWPGWPALADPPLWPSRQCQTAPTWKDLQATLIIKSSHCLKCGFSLSYLPIAWATTTWHLSILSTLPSIAPSAASNFESTRMAENLEENTVNNKSYIQVFCIIPDVLARMPATAKNRAVQRGIGRWWYQGEQQRA